MSSLYRRLKTASEAGKLAEAKLLINGMRDGRDRAFEDYEALTTDAINSFSFPKTPAGSPMAPGEFMPYSAARLMRDRARVRGFLDAIARERNVRTALEIGPGPGALLTIATAVMHENVTIMAVEVNSQSARVAAHVVRLLGFQRDQIEIVEGDAFETALPDVDLGITETFGQALLPGKFNEQGPHLTALLAARAARIVPARAMLFARDGPVDDTTDNSGEWQEAGEVDLTLPPNVHTGYLFSSGAGERNVELFSGFYSANRVPILEECEASALTASVRLGSIAVSHAGAMIGFSYLPGTSLRDHPAELWEVAA